MLRIVCVSDTHGNHGRTILPPGDILLHTGDLTRHGKLDEVEEFNGWLGTLDPLYQHKIVIAGNHDFCFHESPSEARTRLTNAIYLEDEGVEIAGIRIYGSPWQPWFGGWAFNLQRGSELAAIWARIPSDTDILLTHGPPEGILDRNRHGDCCGCRDLLHRVMEIRPRLHVFGHIHEAAGQIEIDQIRFLNASTQLGHGKGVVVEWE